MREIAELNAKINLLLAMNSIHDAELARMQAALTEKNGEISRLIHELATLRSSKIWRLTAPVRSTANFLRKRITSERHRQ